MRNKPTTTVKKSSMRGVVLSYILSEPGEETIRTIYEDLYTGWGTKKRMFNAVLGATNDLHQRGLIYYGEGKNKSNSKLYAVDGAADCFIDY